MKSVRWNETVPPSQFKSGQQLKRQLLVGVVGDLKMLPPCPGIQQLLDLYLQTNLIENIPINLSQLA